MVFFFLPMLKVLRFDKSVIIAFGLILFRSDSWQFCDMRAVYFEMKFWSNSLELVAIFGRVV